jgi:hypothetical protein
VHCDGQKGLRAVVASGLTLLRRKFARFLPAAKSACQIAEIAGAFVASPKARG